ncbi:hypothetical protein CKA32_006447 [Geitlerinema sp. FC II]|nr:hypothetical protein CKA32_006447 [Geitlerinema sp. FC II]
MIQAILNIIIVASSTFLLVSYLVIQKKKIRYKKGKNT